MRVARTHEISFERKVELRAALRTTRSVREWLTSNPTRDEAELLYMIIMESIQDAEHRTSMYDLENTSPRRWILRRLHAAYCRVRDRNEWLELEAQLHAKTRE